MESKKLVVSDLVNFSEKHIHETKDILEKLQMYSNEYTSMDNLYDVEGLERVKRNMIAQLEFLASQYSRIKKYKTMGDYLEETRKFVKAEAIEHLIANSDVKVSVNQAEKTVYAYAYYKDRVKIMEGLKSFFIKVEVMYQNYSNTLSSVIQSISLCRKDPNYKPVETQHND